MNEEEPGKYMNSIDSAQDALLFCDYLGKFGTYEAKSHFQNIAIVIRDLMRRLEEQAAAFERAEASKQ
jgi:hypothetical protein